MSLKLFYCSTRDRDRYLRTMESINCNLDLCFGSRIIDISIPVVFLTQCSGQVGRSDILLLCQPDDRHTFANYCQLFSSTGLSLRTKFSTFACDLFFCCYLFFIRQLVPITASSNSRTSLRLLIPFTFAQKSPTLSFFFLPADFFQKFDYFSLQSFNWYRVTRGVQFKMSW